MMRKVTAMVCFLSLLVNTATSIQGQTQSKPKSQTAKVEKSEAEKAAVQVFAKLQKLINKKDYESASKLMTQEAYDELTSNAIMMALSISQAEFAGADPLVGRVKRTLAKFNLNKIKLPKFMNDPMMEPPTEEEEKELEELEQKIIKQLDKADVRALALRELDKVMAEMVMGMNPFEGKVTGSSLEKEVVTLEIELEMPEMEMFGPGDGFIEIEDDGQFPEGVDELGGMMEMEMPPMFLLFKQEAGNWKYAGFDEEKMEAAFGESGFDIPTIENPEFSGKTVSGEEISLKDFRGKFVLVDFWGTWCGPCVAEIPAQKKIYAALKEHGFEIVGIAMDDLATLKTFSKKTKLPWQNIVDGRGKLADKFGVNAFPTTLLIDQEGKHVASNLFGVKLLDEVISRAELDPAKFEAVRKQLSKHDRGDHGDTYEGEEDPNDDLSDARGAQGIGFEAADANDDGEVSKTELREYLDARLGVPDFPHRKVFGRLDKDASGQISTVEFAKRHEVITDVMGDGFFGMPMPVDPGADYIPYAGLGKMVDDKSVMGAVFHRYQEVTNAPSNSGKNIDLKQIPESISGQLPTTKSAEGQIDRLVSSSVIIAGGGVQGFFTSGGVVISEDGLTLTNYHVAEALNAGALVGMTPDGKVHRVTEFVAGNRERDVALLRLDGQGFKPIPVAKSSPSSGDKIVMLHHSENRFYTYDRGYVMRHAKVGNHPWMEISADYAPGGSGCGIFNERHELIGLVSMIKFGDGPSLAEDVDFADEEFSGLENAPVGEEGEFGMLLVKHAVPLSAIHSLWK